MTPLGTILIQIHSLPNLTAYLTKIHHCPSSALFQNAFPSNYCIHSCFTIQSTVSASRNFLHFTVLTIVADLYKARSSTLCNTLKSLLNAPLLDKIYLS